MLDKWIFDKNAKFIIPNQLSICYLKCYSNISLGKRTFSQKSYMKRARDKFRIDETSPSRLKSFSFKKYSKLKNLNQKFMKSTSRVTNVQVVQATRKVLNLQSDNQIINTLLPPFKKFGISRFSSLVVKTQNS